jgi:pyrroline-5-carboxylate reductase
MEFKNVAIIGAGNLGFSIAQGLISSGLIKKEDLILTEKSQNRIDELVKDGYNVTDSNVKAVSSADLVMLVVKPYQIDAVIEDIKSSIKVDKHVIVSCVTGVDSTHIYTQLGCEPTLFRVMPNTGVAIGESMSCIASFSETSEQKEAIRTIFSQLGEVLFITEELMPAATALAGCGIAFALRFIRACTEAGVEIGFSAADAKIIAAQITKGAAELILQKDTHPEAEIDKVTTPKGITITGLNEMEHAGLSSSIILGIVAAYNKMDHK